VNAASVKLTGSISELFPPRALSGPRGTGHRVCWRRRAALCGAPAPNLSRWTVGQRVVVTIEPDWIGSRTRREREAMRF